MKASKEWVEGVGSLVKRKEVIPVLDSTWRFDDDGVKEAYRRIMTGHARGKVVIRVLNFRVLNFQVEIGIEITSSHDALSINEFDKF